MKIFIPSECKERYKTKIDGRHKSPVIEARNKIWSDPLDEIIDSYTHNSIYVEEAFDLVTWPDLDYVKDRLEIYITNLPSKDYYNGASIYWKDVGTIFLYGKATPIPRYMTHYITIHELGHIVQGLYCNKSESISEYLELRNITTTNVSVWASNWKELWAEDFRWLFSIESAHQNTWNMNFPQPNDKIAEFMLCLVDELHRGEEA
jgi:hypothetical protein